MFTNPIASQKGFPVTGSAVKYIMSAPSCWNRLSKRLFQPVWLLKRQTFPSQRVLVALHISNHWLIAEPDFIWKSERDSCRISTHWLIAEPDLIYRIEFIPPDDFNPLAHRRARQTTAQTGLNTAIFQPTGSSQSQTKQRRFVRGWSRFQPTGSSQSQTYEVLSIVQYQGFQPTGSSQSQTVK